MATKDVVLAGGCFWCIEAAVRNVEGVVDVVSGYATQQEYKKVEYSDVTSQQIKAREAVLVTYDAEVTTFENIVRAYFELVDPIDEGGQFHDRGYSYTTAIYVATPEERKITERIIKELDMSGKYNKPIATRIEDQTYFYPAEEYHQHYKEKEPEHYKRYYKGSGREAFFGK